jgi:hypothetical protein
MRKSRAAAAALALAMLASCAPRAVPPAPTPPAPEPQQQPETPAPPPPAPAVWEDAALTPGDWTYRSEGSGSAATYGTLFTIRCEANRQVTLALSGSNGSALTVRTTYGDRSLAAQPRQGALVATLPASDALLDQMVFSRGRFAVEAPGMQRLILPAWAEPGRVVEDCRS